ncbi:MAG: ATP-dependent DNA helicase RecG [Oscillospiraceae bacterium]|jgi:ATP-dependent DNA helicase RecG|nr:ATP-dependent DNA helicase RecG [Oscillospiraceae bacterium]
MADLNSNVRGLGGVGQQRAKALEKLGIRTLRDLISHFPRRYEDRTKTLPIAQLKDGQSACVEALVASEPMLSRSTQGRQLLKLSAVDETGTLSITFFGQTYLKSVLRPGKSFVFFGKASILGGRRSMTNPLFDPSEGERVVTGRIVQFYHLTQGITSKVLTGLVRQALDGLALQLPDALPPEVTERHKLCQADFAYENIHFPADYISLALAQRRLIFEELFVLAAALTQMKHSRVKKSGTLIHNATPEDFYAALPFEPTGAQKRAVKEALADMASGGAMNRLLQGDVGSGKTLVAAAAVRSVARAGYQAAFMAPTEILANQHFATLSELLTPLGIVVVKLTGSMTAKQKAEAKRALAEGLAALAVGTHALISQGVEFDALALVITDEQHRFGVAQRAALSAKGAGVHTLVMSATPIPRTLALMIYGDLDVSILDELPPGRQKVDTFVVGEAVRARLNGFIKKQVAEGRQVFVVCPAIEENEENPQDIKTAVAHAGQLKRVLPELKIESLHGKMKAAEKDAVMLAFAEGKLDVLVSTTVVEVGVDVPNASLMVVENAERFGLSQLHQLRGRVGRGEHKSYCILLTDRSEYPDAYERLKVLEKTNDGFKISEEDLRLRGPGDFFGSRQHGLPELRIADLLTDVGLLKEAQEAAIKLLESDPSLERPENAALKREIGRVFENGVS